ncbi:MAG TPA: DUF1080 domain-containing protein [Cyclobacteriaceae bacterium]|nr:DUF1080 domain-containing protein [Cyclobacteriaceae bacterium]
MIKSPNLPARLFLLSACLVLSGSCIAQKATKGEWQSLFNGKDITGWEMLNAPHRVEVKDGVLVGTTIPGQDNGFLCTTEQYGDFVLELEVKTDLLLDNTGIQFRSLSSPEDRNGRIHGYQVQLENRPPHLSQWTGSIYDEAGRGFLSIIEDDPVRQKAYKQNQWNKVRIEAIGTTSRVWINNIPTAHVIDDKIMKGIICLQIHGGSHAAERGEQSIYARNIRIQTTDLKPAPYDGIPVANYIPNTISAQEKYQGFELLFDGTTAKNWRGVSQEAPAAGWKIDNGIITVSSEEETSPVAMTSKKYGPFELKFEFKVEGKEGKEGIPGIEYFFDGQPAAKRSALYGRFAIDNARHRAKVNRDIWREWNQGVIKAFPDNHVEYWMNGYKILDYQRTSDQPKEGNILIDAYKGNAVSYRSIKIRQLKK